MLSRKTNLKRTVAALLISSMLLSFGACSQKSKYSLSNIKLTESERSWKNPEEQYAELLKTYGEYVCAGTMAVATDKDIVYLYAEEDKEKDGSTLTSQDTIFDMASVSKTFTAVAILQLAEKKKLSTDDTLDKYFPEYETGKKITIYNLLHMTSGIPDYCNNPDPFWNISGADAANKKLSEIYLDKTTDEEFLQALYKAPLGFEPGTQYEYSNSNYHILAFIIEKVSGMKYCDYVKKNIFDKCGMKKTTSMASGDMTYQPVGFEELARYGFCDKDGYPACPNNCRGDGGIHSCLTDMVAFDRALFGGKLLNKTSMEILLKEESGYCCGLMKQTEGYSHDGSSMTCATNNKIIESEKYGHIYVITLMRTGVAPKTDGKDPMEGTKYTKGVFEGGIFTNEYAGLKINMPEGFNPYSDADLAQIHNDSINHALDDKDKTQVAATKYDAIFYSPMTGDSWDICVVNTRLAAPDDPDYTEKDYLDDLASYNMRGAERFGGYKTERKDTVEVTLGGKKYFRTELLYDDHGEIGHIYLYVRKLDSNLMLSVSYCSWSGKTADYCEKMFAE